MEVSPIAGQHRTDNVAVSTVGGPAKIVAADRRIDSLKLSLYRGRNLLDKEYASNPGGFVADTLGAFRTNVQDPFTYGVEVLYNF